MLFIFMFPKSLHLAQFLGSAKNYSTASRDLHFGIDSAAQKNGQY